MTQNSKKKFLTDGGKMGALMRSFDWSKTTVGPVDEWPQSLCTAINIILNSAFPMFIWWDRKALTNFYNDPYALILGKKHPYALGKSGKVSWKEIWDDVGPLAEKVFATGKPVFMKDLPLTMNRFGYDELTYFTFSYSAIRDETGTIAGLYCACYETTHEVVSGKLVQESEQRFRALVSASSDVVYRMSPDWKEMRQLTGRNFLVDTGKPDRKWMKKYIHPSDHTYIWDAIHRAVTSKSIFELEHKVKRVDGTPGWTFSRAVPICDAKGEIIEWFGTASDITEQKIAEQHVTETSNLLSTILDTAPIGFCLFDKDLRYRMINPMLAKINGFPPEFHIGKSIQEIIPSLDTAATKQLTHVLRTGKPMLGIELTGETKDEPGKIKHWREDYFPIRAFNGEIVGIGALVMDVTQQKLLQQQKTDTLNLLELVLKRAPVGIFQTDNAGNCTFVNARWCEFAGMTQDQAKGQGWVKAIHPDDKQRVFDAWYESVKHKNEFELEYRFKTPEGKVTLLKGNSVSIKDKAKNIIGYLGTVTDITKEKELEKQKDEFLGIASHELKTPVTSIKAYGQVLQKIFQKKDDIRAVEQLEKMDTQINKLTNLIGDLLDVTKIQSGRLEFHEDYFDFNEIVDEIVDELQLTTDRHTFEKNFTHTKTVYGDRERIGQVITNLITNAIKYSPDTDKVIVSTDTNNKEITLCVQDFGVGIPRDKVDKVFEQFFRVSAPKHTTVPGLGLGLFISNEIIKRQGGKIWVNSVEGKGSIFCFSLPIHKKQTGMRK